MKKIITKFIACSALINFCFAAELVKNDIETGRRDSIFAQFSSRSTMTEDFDIESNQCTITINIIEINEFLVLRGSCHALLLQKYDD